MNQSIVNSGHFQPSRDLRTASPAPNLDASPKEIASPVNRRFAVWPVVMIGIGGVATLAWNGFLLWHTARALIWWVGVEI